ncbi:sigma-70 family RNA polymerase sigma factor [Streptomyces sp. NPDC050738]|uniref:sigma-70 family RNA polymerase sigma factor n=1 Tax=Streptomyces sp. NPDC050738 TaxID=3154744 RepID=UPI0034320683
MTEGPLIPPAPPTEVYVEHRELLFSLVYNMLGSVADTDDVLQETWLAWSRRNEFPDAQPIESPRAYLVRIAVNKALARKDLISRRRETYFGPWLPEPLVSTDEADADRSDSVSMALMVVLETLTPLERTVFVLHEVFGYAHTETARILGRSPSAVRQLAHRAREHVQARRPRYRPDPQIWQQVTERFMAANAGGDLEALLEILAEDVTLLADGGGKAPAAGRRPVHGREKVARLLAVRSGRQIPDARIQYRRVNGDPSALLFSGDVLFAVLVLELAPETDEVASIYIVTNPEKLARIA